ncbi:MAG: SCO family protein [Chitinophagales bacterium]
MSTQLERVQENFIREDKLVILSFSIDPLRDTPEKLKEYANSYNAVPGKWHF